MGGSLKITVSSRREPIPLTGPPSGRAWLIKYAAQQAQKTDHGTGTLSFRWAGIPIVTFTGDRFIRHHNTVDPPNYATSSCDGKF